jgi:hypothetical protein
VSHFDNTRFQAAFAGGGVGLHFVELCREESLGADSSIEPRRWGAVGEIWVFSFSDVQRDGRAGFWETLRVTRGLQVALALSLTNGMWVEREFNCFKHVMKSASGDDMLMVGEM